jgi:hypothetical protein
LSSIKEAKTGMVVQGKTTLSRTPKKRTSPVSTALKKDSQTEISVMPTSEVLPLWLSRLYIFQRNTSIMTFFSVGATLLVYGWTVYSQEIWSQSFKKLDNLQRQERQLTVTNGVLKSKMAADAEKNNSGLTSITPQKTIFLTPTPGSPNQTSPNLPANPEEVQLPNSVSPGY